MEDANERRAPPIDEAFEPTLQGSDVPDSYVRTARAEPAPPASGELAQRYAIAHELGRGGMGLVLCARDRRLGRTVALKSLLPQHAANANVLRRFLVEAQVGAQLEHPNIVPVYGMEESGAQPAFSMRLLEGSTLRAYIKECKAQVQRGALAEENALPERLERFLKICDAIAYAHSRGVIHRDIKPDNVILGEHRELYVVDWGVAKVLADESEPEAAFTPTPAPLAEGVPIATSGTTTRHGEMIGTPTYMAPEQARGELELHGPASDQFGLAMVLQELITLERPRDGNAMEQIFAACEGERRSLARTGEGTPTPPALKAIVARATAFAPEARYPSVEALAADVRRFLRDDDVSVWRAPWTRRAWRALSRRPGLALGAFLGVIILALLGTTLSAFRTIEAQREAAGQAERLSVLTGMVVGRSEHVDARFSDTKVLVEGLATATAELLERGATGDAPRFGAAGWLAGDGPPLRGLHSVARYGMDVTFDMALYLHPPDVPHEAIAPTLASMAPLDSRFRSVLLRSLDPAAIAWPRARQDAALDAGETPLHVTYVGFENGLLLNYPGYLPFPDDYDPRRRTWYRAARDRWDVHFGRPYPDASGSAILIPCNRAVRDADGALLAVVGADMAVDDLARAMRIDDAPGWIRSSLVDGEGRQIVDTEQAGIRLGVGLHGDAPVEARPIDPESWRAIQAKGTGFLRQGEVLLVFDRLESIDWTFVVHLDAKRAMATATATERS